MASEPMKRQFFLIFILIISFLFSEIYKKKLES